MARDCLEGIPCNASCERLVLIKVAGLPFFVNYDHYLSSTTALAGKASSAPCGWIEMNKDTTMDRSVLKMRDRISMTYQ